LESFLTSSATTLNPRPASPARAASMAAFKASRLVCAAMLPTSCAMCRRSSAKVASSWICARRRSRRRSASSRLFTIEPRRSSALRIRSDMPPPPSIPDDARAAAALAAESLPLMAPNRSTSDVPASSICNLTVSMWRDHKRGTWAPRPSAPSLFSRAASAAACRPAERAWASDRAATWRFKA
jgi:hypothetical protein